ncbi:hypothetical protein AVEN_111863-1 [Araneus ventricosus]|uniref:Uncharacterized protein n=1 Tax=Araneus ventricosus TaxID=182803 RepID=A0A4Y2BXD7_ARAVE|nr:hypothetical protein AVEN_111863-1 [Araneus ventricosus]
MKHSLRGYSCVLEVDSDHSNIEKAINKTDFYSPIGLIKILKQVNPRHPYRVIQMWRDDFKDFQGTAKLLNYKIVPFTSVAILKFSENPAHGWIASTYQRDTEPRDYQECSQADHTALFGAPEPETQFETPNPFLPPFVLLSSNIQFYSPLQGVELRLPFTTLDNGTAG